ncbi:ABC transporter ATP-binding protein [Dermabacter sp. HSID17554]|uniref:ABC transporter ATP-binding protein n=1 Tax=Dermabacter sp. HSID17554 TaxID=2419511 RepID=UPI000F881301|nr:ABC transporter ATP-binding protein [Dermabacter sp. HSID17554]RUP85702.1 ABC transporter ATP-binding protein [Dermabacter sp. HSID17554]
MSEEKKHSERGVRPGQKAQNFGPSFTRLMGFLMAERTLLFSALGIGIISVILSVIGPKILGRATDIIFNGVVSKRMPAGVTKDQVVAGMRASGQEQLADMVSGMDLNPGHGIDFGALNTVLLTVTVLYVVAAFFAWLQTRMLLRVVYRSIYRLRRDVEEKLHRVPLSYFDSRRRGDLLSRVTNDVDNLQNTLNNTLGGIISDALTVVGTIIMMLVISPILTLVALIVIPLALVITAVIGKRAQKLFGEQWDATGEVNSEVEEAFSGHEIVTVFGREKDARANFEKKNAEMYRASFGAQFVSSLIMPFMMFAGNISYAAVALVGGLKVVSGQLTLGDVQAFIQYSRQFTQPVSHLASMVTQLQSGVASAERIFEFLDAEEQARESSGQGSDACRTKAEATSPGRGEVRFDHVRFSYSPEKPLISDLSLVASPGMTVAIVGPTGAGKTTLVNLIMRFYEIDGGTITIDGVDTRDMTREELRSRTGMVLQDTWLFKGTIRENIRYGRLDASDEEVLEAAKATHVHDFVQHLPEGYDTIIDDEGSSVSAGEKQLLTIARAFLARPELLILDEATSSVDTRTEVLVQKAMNTLREGRTSFVIAHRLSTIRDADLILVMEHGDIVEQGTHDELLEAGGAYARLYRSQFEGASSEIADAPEQEPVAPAQDSPMF